MDKSHQPLMSPIEEFNIKAGVDSNSKKTGWLLVVFISAIFLMLYISAIIVTKYVKDGCFQYRAWTWLEYFIGLCSVIVIFKTKRNLKTKYVLYGLFFSLICMVSFYSRSNDLITGVTDSAVTFLAFLAGSIIRSNNDGVRVSVMDISLKKALKSLGMGIIFSIPLSLLNFWYFAYSQGKIEWQNPLVAVLHALQPGIGEEIIFRFFIMNILYALLKNKLSQKPLKSTILALSVIPHSLLHYPDLWLTNISGAIFMMIFTCILFGLPMAYLQYKRDLEASIGFHWFIDALRAFGGFF